MLVRRGLLVLTVIATLLSGVIPVSAQVDEAQQRADQAATDAADAHAVVSSAVENRDAVEAALFTALDEYQSSATELSDASVRLKRVNESLAFADAATVTAEDALATKTVTAYIEAISGTPAILLDSRTAEDALVVGEIVRESQSDALATLADLLTRRADLERITQQQAEELANVRTLTDELSRRADDLQALFATANTDVAAAYASAAAADANYQAALAGVDAAVAQEEAARQAAIAATSTTTTTRPTTTTTRATTTTTTGATTSTTDPAASTTTSSTTTTTAPTTTTTVAGSTTTTTVPPSWPPIPISDRVMAWKPTIEQYFAPDLVLDALVIMQCESLGDPNAVNPYSGASGLFQFMPGTWAVASVQAGVGDRSVFDGEANIIAASWLAEYYRDHVGDPWRPWSCRAYL